MFLETHKYETHKNGTQKCETHKNETQFNLDSQPEYYINFIVINKYNLCYKNK